MPIQFEKTALEGVTLCIPDVFRDARGFYLECYHAAKYMEGGVRAVFVQDNRSRSSRTPPSTSAPRSSPPASHGSSRTPAPPTSPAP